VAYSHAAIIFVLAGAYSQGQAVWEKLTVLVSACVYRLFLIVELELSGSSGRSFSTDSTLFPKTMKPSALIGLLLRIRRRAALLRSPPNHKKVSQIPFYFFCGLDFKVICGVFLCCYPLSIQAYRRKPSQWIDLLFLGAVVNQFYVYH